MLSKTEKLTVSITGHRSAQSQFLFFFPPPHSCHLIQNSSLPISLSLSRYPGSLFFFSQEQQRSISSRTILEKSDTEKRITCTRANLDVDGQTDVTIRNRIAHCWRGCSARKDGELNMYIQFHYEIRTSHPSLFSSSPSWVSGREGQRQREEVGGDGAGKGARDVNRPDH